MSVQQSSPRHPHPVYLLQMLYRVLFLLIIPLLRGAITALTGGFTAWLAGAWFDLMILGGMFTISLLRWLCCTYTFDGQAFQVAQGLLVRQTRTIPWNRVAALTLVRPFYLKPLGASLLRLDTLAGIQREADLSLPISRREGLRILEIVSPIQSAEAVVREYRPKNTAILILSMVSSNFFAGLLLVATFINQLGQIAGEELSQRIVGTFHELTKALAFGIPPAAAGIAYLLLFGWLVVFCFNLVRNKNFRVRREGELLTIRGGLFTNREYRLRAEQINCADIRQTLLTRMMGLRSVFLYAVGFGKAKDDMTALIPAASGSSLLPELSLLLPELTPCPNQLSANREAFFKFIWQPLYLCILIPAGTLLSAHLLPGWGRFILFTGMMATLPAIWLLAIRLLELFTCGIGRQGDTFTLRYSKGFYLHTTVLHKEKIAQISFQQHPFQRMDDRCDVIIRCRSEGRHRIVVKNLERRKAGYLFGVELPPLRRWRGPLGWFHCRNWKRAGIPWTE